MIKNLLSTYTVGSLTFLVSHFCGFRGHSLYTNLHRRPKIDIFIYFMY